MRVCIGGSRSITNLAWLEHAIARSGFDITVVISGKEPHGVDHLGELWALANGIPVEPYPADWGHYGLAAGPMRNGTMARVSEAAVILRVPRNQKSNGSDNLFIKMSLYSRLIHREIQGEKH